MTDTAPSAKTPAPAIYALTIERFRGITALRWKPSRGVNVILGGGDVGKTTILEAIALLLSPANPTTLSDPDYHDRDIEAGCGEVREEARQATERTAIPALRDARISPS
jgi:putative ATP-dependent endonuclease of the OLD family